MSSHDHTVELPRLNLPKITGLRLRRDHAQRLQIWDAARKQWLVLTPEEWVRQHFIHLLISAHAVPYSLVVQEYYFGATGLRARADIVVFAPGTTEPWLVVECKAPSVALSQEVLEQVGRYNTMLSVQYVAVTNGMQHAYFRVDHATGSCAQIPVLPIV